MRGILSLCIAHHAASGPGLRTNDSEDERPRSVGSNDEIIPKKYWTLYQVLLNLLPFDRSCNLQVFLLLLLSQLFHLFVLTGLVAKLPKREESTCHSNSDSDKRGVLTRYIDRQQ